MDDKGTFHLCEYLDFIKTLSIADQNEYKKEIEAIVSDTLKQGIKSIGLEYIAALFLSTQMGLDDFSYGAVTAYGAGKMARTYISEILKYDEIKIIYDAYSDASDINGVPIERPFLHSDDINRPVVVFIDEPSVRSKVCKLLRENGYSKIYYFRSYLDIKSAYEKISTFLDELPEAAIDILKNIPGEYAEIKTDYAKAYFIKWKKEHEKLCVNLNASDINETELKDILTKDILFKISEEKLTESIKELSRRIASGHSLIGLLEAVEIFTEEVLQGNTKTKKRPLAMANDKPYDKFAMFKVLYAVINMIFDSNFDDKKLLLENLCELAPESTVSKGCLAISLSEFGEYEKALETARLCMVTDSNDLLANEVFYKIACECKEKGIYVEEPIPEYDLNKHFCWCGFSFAWCPEFNMQDETAVFGPCFRPLQCAARPEGDFWTGDDWKEFRSSIIDGSFKYCQKNQCSNIVSGWLPKKEDVKDENLMRLLKGNTDIIPELSELHFSYDGHCNLKCPSCRTEYRTNSKAEKEKFDYLYDKNLKPLVKNAKHLCLSGCGEAIISPHSKRILMSLNVEEYPELEVELRTNMTAVNETTWESLGEGRKCIRHIAASIDSCTKDNFEKIRFPAKWDIVYNNLKFVQKLRNNGELDMFEFHVVIQKDNVEELLDIVKFAIDLDADCVTFSRLINWRDMPEDEYKEVNPFWVDNPYHKKLKEEWDKIIAFRESIERGEYKPLKKKFYINMHFVPDPNETYDEIRVGRIRIR